MKKIFLIALTIAFTTFSSCKKWVEVDQVSPNNLSKAGLAQYLLASEVATFQNETVNIDRTASVLVQQLAGLQFQMQSVAIYDIKEDNNQDDWYGLYTGALVNIKSLIDNAGSANPYYRGIGEVLKAMNLGIATDTWGDVPDAGASNGAAGTTDALNPPFEAQKDIYADIQNLLTAAIADLSQPTNANATVPGSDDLIFSGTISSWLQNAWILKARYDIHLTRMDANGSSTKALADLTNANATSSANDMFAVFGSSSSNNNQWYSFQNLRTGYVLMSKPFINKLKTTNDPRLPYYATKDTGGGYSGSPIDPDSANASASDVGTYLAGMTASIPMVTYVEAEFIAAEANFRLGNTGAAAAAYNTAVAASVLQVTGSAIPATFKALVGNETANTISLAKIMGQKYVALFGQYEVWNDYRRTNLPALNPCAAGLINVIPKRLPTVVDERLYNKNAVVVDDITKPVWWDQ